MSDDVTQSINVEFNTRGFQQTLQNLVKLSSELEVSRKAFKNTQEGLDDLGRQGTITAGQLKQASKALEGYAKTLNKDLGGRNYQNASTSLDAMISSQQQLGKEFSRGLQSRMAAEQTHLTQTGVALDQNMRRQVETFRSLQSAGANTAASLPRLRYALYDVSTTATFAGAAMLGLATAVVGAAVTMDRDFADVVRTTGTYLDETGEATANLRTEFNDLFSSLPSSWSDLTDIGTLAGQLGVASENAAEFTRLVAMFSATTDVSVEQSATAFGRLSELLKVPASQFENLGSSILAVGVSSVATESQIIAISTQIASMGNFAGLSAQEVVGLSSSLASLGVQPELSRGTITRLFTQITTAVSEGGDKLSEFSRLAGTDFASAWKTAPMEAFLLVLKGLEAEGDGAISALANLGITASRDIPTLLKLAQNYQLVSEQLGIASEGFDEGSALAEQYGVIAETTAAKLTVLVNNLKLLIGSAGESSSGPLSALVDVLTVLLKIATTLVQNPIGQFFALLGTVVAVVAGSLALMVGASTRATASLLALKTAELDAAAAGITLGRGSGLAAFGLETLGLSAKGAATAIRGIKYALVSTGVGIALVALGEAVAALWSSFEDSNVFNKFGADLSGLADALRGDTESVLSGTAESLNEFTVSFDESGKVLSDAEVQAANFSDAMNNVGKSVDDATESVRSQLVAVGALTKEWLLNAVTTGELGERFTENLPAIESALDEMGLTLEDAFNRALTGDGVNFQPVLDRLKSEIGVLASELDAETAKLGGLTGADYDAQILLVRGLTQEYEALQSRYSAIQSSEGIFNDLGTSIQDAAEKVQWFNAASEALGVELPGAADAVAELNERVKEVRDTFESVVFAAADTQSALYNLGKSLAENGDSWDLYSASGRGNLELLRSVMNAMAAEAGGDVATTANAFEGLYQYLIQRSPQAAASIAFVHQEAVALAAAAGVQLNPTVLNTTSLMAGFGSATEKAGKAVGSAAKKVRTLTDYVSDLAKVMGDAFDFRFGFEESTDATLSSFRDIEQAFEDARQKVRDLTLAIQEYQAEISGIASDISILEYHLTIAEEYNDTLRAAAIRSELEQANAKLAKTQSELTDAQSEYGKAVGDATPDLESSTEGAIEQRKAVLDLVKSYQAQIEAYAATGASQQQIAAYTDLLRTRFEAQLRSLGYSEAAIRKYSLAFQDFKKVIDGVPRDLTMSVNVDPAIRALDEYNAKLNATRSNASAGGFAPTGLDDSALKKAARGLEYYVQLVNLQREAAGQAQAGLPIPARVTSAISLISKLLQSGSYYDGGFTGHGGMYEPAGVVHRGEYVVPKKDVNQRTGLPYADALDRLGRGVPSPAGYARGGYVQGAQTGFSGFSAAQIQQLERIFRVTLKLDGKTIADSSSQQYATSSQRGSR